MYQEKNGGAREPTLDPGGPRGAEASVTGGKGMGIVRDTNATLGGVGIQAIGTRSDATLVSTIVAGAASLNAL